MQKHFVLDCWRDFLVPVHFFASVFLFSWTRFISISQSSHYKQKKNIQLSRETKTKEEDPRRTDSWFPVKSPESFHSRWPTRKRIRRSARRRCASGKTCMKGCTNVPSSFRVSKFAILDVFWNVANKMTSRVRYGILLGVGILLLVCLLRGLDNDADGVNFISNNSYNFSVNHSNHSNHSMNQSIASGQHTKPTLPAPSPSARENIDNASTPQATPVPSRGFCRWCHILNVSRASAHPLGGYWWSLPSWSLYSNETFLTEEITKHFQQKYPCVSKSWDTHLLEKLTQRTNETNLLIYTLHVKRFVEGYPTLLSNFSLQNSSSFDLHSGEFRNRTTLSIPISYEQHTEILLRNRNSIKSKFPWSTCFLIQTEICRINNTLLASSLPWQKIWDIRWLLHTFLFQQIVHSLHNKWIWVLDADALFVTRDPLVIKQGMPLKEVSEETNIIIGQDGNGLNTGSFFLRVCPWSFQLIQAWLLFEDDKRVPMSSVWWEQATLISVLVKNNILSIQSHMQVFSSPVFNVYMQNFNASQSIVLHGAGVGGINAVVPFLQKMKSREQNDFI